MRKLLDVNVMAISLIEDHPGYPYIEPVIQEGLKGSFTLLIPSVLPFRVCWILTTKWDVPRKVAEEIVGYFVKNQPAPEYFGLNQTSIQEAFTLARELNHDIYDCYYLAAAHQMNANSIITTDSGFEKLCSRVSFSLEYENPVPEEILGGFREFHK